MAHPSPYAAAIARTPVRVADLTLSTGRTRCWTYGHDDAPLRVVFVHGLRGDHHGLEPIVAHLVAHPDTPCDTPCDTHCDTHCGARLGVQVLVPDLPGFGESEPLRRGDHDVPGYAAWIRDLLAAVDPDSGAVLAGHSFGSVVAAAAVAGGAPVRGLVLVNPIAAPPAQNPRVGATRLTVLYHRLAAALPERAGTALLRSRVVTRLASAAMVRTRDRALRRWIHDEHDRRFSGFADRRVLLAAFHASLGGHVGASAAAVGAPTLLVAGDRDDLAPLSTQRELVRRFPDARLVVVPGAGHLTHYEAPAAVAEAIAGFLAAHAPSR